MADLSKRLETNTPGDFYVDATCINCDTCRQLAPGTFEEVGDYSAVTHQPTGNVPLHQAYQALLACPVGSIGTVVGEKRRLQAAKGSFPLLLDGGVYFTGFNSEQSFGANSYLIRHPEGNWLIDSPRYLRQLVEAFERMGGIRYIFLTHEDDVADADRFARRFGAIRIIHESDADAAPGAEWVITGGEPVEVSASFKVIPVPGHTPGSLALLYENRYLFSGDHLWWDRQAGTLDAPRRLVWDAPSLVQSLARLLEVQFEWILPGHGERVRLPAKSMKLHLQQLIQQRSSEG